MAELMVDTGAVLQNYRHFAADGEVIPVLKANGCGLGLGPMQALLRSWGVRRFACSTPEEALYLSRDGDSEVLLLSCIHNPETLLPLVRQGVTLAIESLEQVEQIDALGIPARVHLAVDTGFGRFGFPCGETDQMKRAFFLPNVRVCGIYSHFRSEKSAPAQFAAFNQVLEALRDYDVGLRHIAATQTALDPRYRLDAVRIGTGLTGRCPGLQPAARLTARICSMRHLPRGTRIGYGDIRLRRDTDVAILEVGTSDGAFLRRYSGFRSFLRSLHRYVYLCGGEARVLGCPGLTHTEVDVTGLRCQIGDHVVVDQSPVLVSPAVPRRYL
ncbi:MAG: alanine racemase [Oscillospiraceae bacterium]|nr:alanine racemase [Oscillospiraceae bacterium]